MKKGRSTLTAAVITILPVGVYLLFAFPAKVRAMDWDISHIPDTCSLWFAASIEIAVDKSNSPHVINGATFTQSNLKYWEKVDSTWICTEIDKDGSSLGAIALDAQNLPHVIYRKANACTLKYAYNDGTTWHFETIGYCYGEYSVRMCLELDAADQPHVAYLGRDSTYRLCYAHKANGNWGSEIADSMFSSGNDISMAIDQNGHPHIANWARDNGTCYERYTYHDGVQWRNSSIEPVGDVNVMSSSIILDEDGRPHIAYLDHFTPPKLRYAYWDGNQWNITTVDDNFFLYGGSNVSMVFDQLHKPHIIYGSEFNFFAGNSELRYAYKNGTGDWIVEVVDTVRDCGELNSMAIDGLGHLHALYYSGIGGTLGRLMYAISGNTEGIEEQTTNRNKQVLSLKVFPNPFRERTNIQYQISSNHKTEMAIYDAAGRLVKQFNQSLINQTSWDGIDDSGKRISSGIYFLKLTNGDQTKVEKLLLVK